MTNKNKTGYRMMFQSGLSDQQFKDAWAVFVNFKNFVEKNNGYWKKMTKGGYDSALKRRGHGEVIKSNPEPLIFRRVSTKRRVFAIVKKNEVSLKKPDPNRPYPKDKEPCRCGQCTIHEKYSWKNGAPPPMYTVFELGDIKGQ